MAKAAALERLEQAVPGVLQVGGGLGLIRADREPEAVGLGPQLVDPLRPGGQERDELLAALAEDVHRQGGPLCRIADLGDAVGEQPELLVRREGLQVGDGQPELGEGGPHLAGAAGGRDEAPLHRLEARFERLQVGPRLLGGEAQLREGLGRDAGAGGHLVEGVAGVLEVEDHAGDRGQGRPAQRDQPRPQPGDARAERLQLLGGGVEALDEPAVLDGQFDVGGTGSDSLGVGHLLSP
jgi:hypothetical protein